ncbi:Sua5/YciO/YrdC/YwlC family protein [Candidatus Laterigemmans baculatus]|uniref:Sua5/YciO/YrdC/YwlC family protein n=1 Tax=Candidatus Laterigemmans baculatus TaxID=2770505 RepID=UPI0013DD1223|nr:Sua5/YciO/YrdC/YwlC family protein [Candidatus Laterigemmans baculatus]
MANVVDLQRAEDPRDIVHRAVQVLAEGGIVGVPTETVYGLAACGLSEGAVQRLVELKPRDDEAPMALAISSASAAWDYFGDAASPLAQRLARRCWPGPVTLVVPCDSPSSAASRLPAGVRERVIAADGCLGFRVVAHPLFEQLHRFIAGPIVLSSATPTGHSPPTTGAVMGKLFGDRVPLLIDDGPTRYGGPSTVVRVDGNRIRILREGVVETAAIKQFTKPLLVIVCTGNTCRSPMAEVLLRERFRKLTGREDAVGVVSAGLNAFAGDPAATPAVEVMGRRGLDLTGHASQPMSEQLLQLADVILTMTRGHREMLLARYPEAADRVYTLRIDGGDISDPVGCPTEVYEACADQIDAELERWMERLQPQLIDDDPPSSPPTSSPTANS